MRFAIAGIDRYVGAFEAFIQAGWKPVKLFTVPIENAVDSHSAVTALAAQHSAPIQLSRLTDSDLQFLRQQECDALIVGCYPWRIPDWQPNLKYAVNFHCSPLPEARGPYPITRAILEGRSGWALTCHRLAASLDTGEILATEEFPLQPDECHESLDLKTQMAARKLAARLARQFTELWEQATPQGEGSYWPNYKIEERVIDFHQPVAGVLRHIRAYGRTESLARVNDRWLIVKRAVGWPESHSQPPGTVVHVYKRAIVVTAADGYIGLLEADMAGPNIVEQLARSPAG
jgi:methionyl-tRNA formyltransferase